MVFFYEIFLFCENNDLTSFDLLVQLYIKSRLSYLG